MTLTGFAADLLSYPSIGELFSVEVGADGTADNTSPVNRDPLDSCHWQGKWKGIMEFGIMEFGPSAPSALEKKEVVLPFF